MTNQSQIKVKWKIFLQEELKKIPSTLFQGTARLGWYATIGLIPLSIVAVWALGMGNTMLQLIQIPIPLWVTIIVAFLSGLLVVTNQRRSSLVQNKKNKKEALDKEKKHNEHMRRNFLTNDPEILVVTIKINYEYIRNKQILDGVTIENEYKFKIKLKDVTKNQRLKLMDIFHPAFETIPNYLYLPLRKKKASKGNSLVYGLGVANQRQDNNFWFANLDPKRTTPKNIMKSWEKDYDIFNK